MKNICKEKKALTVREFQGELGIGYDNAMKLVHTEGFPKIVVGRRILIVRSQLDSWLEKNIGKDF